MGSIRKKYPAGLKAKIAIESIKGEKAFTIGRPDIFNSDQGYQFTNRVFIDKLRQKNVQISMDGRGRAMDNVFTERLWRSIKYEDIKDYKTVLEAKEGISLPAAGRISNLFSATKNMKIFIKIFIKVL